MDLKKRESEASSFLEFLGLSASFRGDGGDAIAILALPETEIRRLVESVRDMSQQDSASLAALQKLAGKVRFAQRAIIGGIGRAALNSFYELLAKKGGALPRSVKDCLRSQELALPAIAPRLLVSLRCTNPADPLRLYSDATEAGKLASASAFSCDEGRRPVLLVAKAAQKLEGAAATL